MAPVMRLAATPGTTKRTASREAKSSKAFKKHVMVWEGFRSPWDMMTGISNRPGFGFPTHASSQHWHPSTLDIQNDHLGMWRRSRLATQEGQQPIHTCRRPATAQTNSFEVQQHRHRISLAPDSVRRVTRVPPKQAVVEGLCHEGPAPGTRLHWTQPQDASEHL